VRTPKRCVTAEGEVYFKVRYRNPPGGPQREMQFYGESEAAARSDADEFRALLSSLGAPRAVKWWNEHLDQQPGEQAMTLDEWWPQYLESLTGVAAGTRDGYDGIYKRVWAPTLGPMPLTGITRPDVARVINKRAGEVADKTVANEYGILTGALKVAVIDGHLAALPTTGIKLPRNTDHESEDMRFLTHDEWWRVHDALPKHYRPLFTFLVGTAARYGEAEALTVGDVDLDGDRPVVRIAKAAKWNATSRTRDVGPTKTRRSRRVVTLPPEVVEVLEPLVDRPAGERLFLAPRGGHIRHKPVWDVWVDARDKAKLTAPQPRIHDLRHTHVAWLIARGVPLPVIQRRLGHESIKTTIDRYGHLLPELEAAATEAASIAMRPRGELLPPAVDE
jgi:integrase